MTRRGWASRHPPPATTSAAAHHGLFMGWQVDQFSKMHDFARAYGSLCWNLSKVIPRKDLPR